MFLEGRSCHLDLNRPRIMGILNVTPDSFSDGGQYIDCQTAVVHARKMALEGADLIDIGGESTRPGAQPVSQQEEMDRVLPVVERVHKEVNLPISIDTTKSRVAEAAIEAGCAFVNDVSGLMTDSAMGEVVARSGAGLFVMHARGRPADMQLNTTYDDVVEEVFESLKESLRRAERAGVARTKLAIDPGIGFGKDLLGNLELLRRLDRFTELGRPVLIGTSRKSFLGAITGKKTPEKRLAGTLATLALGVAGGARIFRVHDIAPAREALMTAWAVCQGQNWLEPK
ncbi:MAG: dihydropteroate synthase [Deltaproteobacteria bacterium]|nr:dihydropteroate synthase [Deltaproteobacteria bacterium]